MADLNNPAGRLHALLAAYGSNDTTILKSWSRVLGVPSNQVHLHLGQVGQLLLDVERAARETGEESFAGMPGDLQKLSRCIFPTDKAFTEKVGLARPDAGAMKALAMLSTYLKVTASDGVVPDDEQVDPVREAVRDLQAEVEDSDLDAEVKSALRHRLTQMLDALDHLDVGGPDAVRRAAEALAATLAVYNGSATDEARPLFTRGRAVARTALELVKVPATLAAALGGVDALFGTNLLETTPPPKELPPPCDEP